MRSLSLVFSFLLLSCASNPPLLEYTIARTSLQSAKQIESARFAASYWHQASEYYRAGVAAFNDKDYSKAKEFFDKAVYNAEKAENLARLKRLKTGEDSL